MPKRIIVTRYGGPDALQVVEHACPEPKRGEVRVKVRAAGVALPDLLAREAFIPKRHGAVHARMGSDWRG